MKCESRKRLQWLGMAAVVLMIPAVASGQNACVEQGALAFDNWTRSDAGGSGLPAGEANADYVRCKACHGWDRLGADGGYVRRTRTSSRPNAGAGDGDSTPRAIDTGTVVADQIAHGGTGRSYADGSGSWVALGASHNAQNKAEHEAGYTLGNQHPDFSSGGANGGSTLPTGQQIDCLVQFLNYEDADWSAYFAAIYPGMNPVLYSIVDTADAAAGEVFYENNCEGCHDAPADFLLGYVAEDGKYSELAHKARWGIPNTEMTRDEIGNPTSADIANLMLYLQQLGGTGFQFNAGLNGNWYNGAERNGEGFQLEVAAVNGLTLVATFYTYDAQGNQVWLLGVGPANGNTAEVTVYIYDGASWGDDFNPADVNEVEWGTGTFVAHSCASVSMSLTPNAGAVADGFTDLEYDLERVTTPATACPVTVANN